MARGALLDVLETAASFRTDPKLARDANERAAEGAEQADSTRDDFFEVEDFNE